MAIHNMAGTGPIKRRGIIHNLSFNTIMTRVKLMEVIDFSINSDILKMKIQGVIGISNIIIKKRMVGFSTD